MQAGGSAASGANPTRRQWGGAGGASLVPDVRTTTENDELDLQISLILARVRAVVVKEKINWMHIFAMFDRKGDGVLGEADFSRAMTAMPVGLSREEIDTLFMKLRSGTSSGDLPIVYVADFQRALNGIQG